MGEVYAAFELGGGFGFDVCAFDAVEESAFGDEVAFEAGVGGGPGLAAVFGAGEEVSLGGLAVDCVAVWAEVFVVAYGESDEDFVFPCPDAVVGGPSSELHGFVEDFYVCVVGGVELLGGGEGG